jgi:undecaprenyl-diphosphatase
VTVGARRARIWIALLGALVTLVAALGASGGDVAGWDRRLLTMLNGLPDAFAVVEVPMELGTLGLLPLVAVVVALAAGRAAAGGAVVVAALTAWLAANRLKEVVERGRPGSLLDGVEVRVDASGFGYPSSHAAVAAAAATVALRWVPARWRWLPVALAVVVGFARVYTGVHFPLDVVGGGAIGVTVGAVVDLVSGVRSPR